MKLKTKMSVIGNNTNTRVEKINEKLLNIRTATFNPDEYIYNYFSDLKTEVDIAANIELASEGITSQTENELSDNWIALIDQVKQFERECLQTNSLSINLADTLKRNKIIDSIQRKLTDAVKQEKNAEIFNDIENQLDDELDKLEKFLFCNKTLIFLDKQKCELKSLFSKMNLNVTIGKLIFVTNEYFNKDCIEQLKHKVDMNYPNLKSNHLKMKCLRKLLETNLRLEQIETVSLDLSSLTKIDLSNSEISTIQKNIFRNMTELVKINLSNNKLTSVDPELFVGLTKLKEINLSSNFITNIKHSTLHGLNNLRWIWLQNNNIESIDSALFSNLTSLAYIHLDHNKLKTLDKKIFNGLKKLQVINLSNNKLATIDKHLLNGLISLDCIDMSNNKLKAIEYETFYGLSKLSHINLSYNRINILDPSLFEGLNNLRAVYLNGNQLDLIEKSQFRGLPIFWFDYYDISDQKLQSKFFSLD